MDVFLAEQSWLLTAIIFSPLAGALLIWLPPYGDGRSVRRSAMLYSLLTLGLTIYALYLFQQSAPQVATGEPAFQLQQRASWLSHPGDDFKPAIDISYHVGIDGISIWLLVLTSMLMPLCILSSFTAIRNREREYYSLLLLLQVGMLGVFCSMDLLLFYVFFEFTLIPLYFLIGIWGGPNRRQAANKFFIFTLTGSVLTFAGILYLAYYAYTDLGYITLSIQKLTELGQSGFISPGVQWWLFLAFAAGFAIKVPLFPVHTWLPLAHTEAPTAGSVILAGVLLKLGTWVN